MEESSSTSNKDQVHVLMATGWLSWIETAQAAESWQLREAPCLRFRLPMSSVVEGRRLCFRQGQCSTPSQCGCVQVGLKDYEDRHWDETRPSKKWRAQPERSF